MTPSNLLQVLSGTATPPTLALQSGVELAPQSLGRVGMWFIDGEGVLDVHGYLYWDGAQLYVQSHDPQRPMLAGGAPVPLDWTPVAAPVVLSLGQVQISFSAVGPTLSDAPTQLGGSPFNQGFSPYEAPAAAAVPQIAPVMLGAPPGAKTMPPPGKGGSAKSLKDPKQLAMLGGIVVLLGGAGWMFLAPAAPPPAPEKPLAPALSATAPTAVVVAPPAPREALPLVPATPLAKGVAPATTELRLATDALLAGREAEAQKLFDALAAKHPDHPELQGSAQLLRNLKPPK